MPYEYLGNIALADVAFRARADSVDGLFSAAAEALLGAMVCAPDTVRPAVTESFSFDNPQLDLLLFAFLNELVFLKDARGLLLRPVSLRTSQTAAGWHVSAEMAGERVDPARHEIIVDVKAITLHRFDVHATAGGWEATVVLDV